MKTDKRPDIVMLHGAFCGPWVFDGFRQPFEAAGWRVHAPALRHHALARKPPRELGTTSLIDYAADLERFVAGLDQTPVLLGHSLGGLLAQMLAAKSLAKALVLLAPCAPWGIMPSTLFEIASAQTLMFAGNLSDRVLQPDYDIAASHSLDRLLPPERKRVFAGFVPESGLATFEIMHWGWDAKRASLVKASDVTCPVLCLTGQHDRINPPSTVRRTAERYRGAVYEDIPGHSHWLIGEPGWEKIAARHLVAVSAELAKTKPGADREGARTILCDDDPAFVLYRVAYRYGLPVVPQWAPWFMCELHQRKAITPLLGLGCSPVLVRGNKQTFLKWIGRALSKRLIRIPEENGSISWKLPSTFLAQSNLQPTLGERFQEAGIISV